MKRFLFVCTGNTCRSPMAEALLRRSAEQRGMAVEVRSVGVAAWPNLPMSNNAKKVLAAKGIDAESFRSSEVTQAAVDWADMILTMTTQHKRNMLEMFPDAVDKTFVLQEWAQLNPQMAAVRQEHESLLADLQVKLALGQPITEEEKERLVQLQQQLPVVDIRDPVGGSLATYMHTASEIEAAITAILARIDGQT
jgi:protein-tyrosine-phosphatase